MKRTLWLGAALAAMAACGAPHTPEVPAGTATAWRLETVATNLEVPWGMVFGPDGELYVTERPGRVRVIRDGALAPRPIYEVPDVVTGSEIGLMAIALHPDFARNRWAYLAYGYRSDAVKVVRYRLADDAMTVDRVVIEALPAASNHAGCALGFGPDRKLYITTGDATTRAIAQDLGSLGGKTLRLEDDGTVPSDNPFVGRAGARPEIWSYGHRNAQGLAWQPGSLRLWQTEHGPSTFDGPGGGDEVNVVDKGANYGWPLVSHEEHREGTVHPQVTWTPAQAPAAGTFYHGTRLPDLRGNFLFGCLRGHGVMRLVVDGTTVVRQEKLWAELGRCRAIAVGPDGALYFGTSNRDGRGDPTAEDDRILRVVPSR